MERLDSRIVKIECVITSVIICKAKLLLCTVT